MDSEYHRVERFKCALDLCLAGERHSWQIFGLFLLGQSVLISFVMQKFVENWQGGGTALELTIPSIFGLLLCLPWYIVISRNRDYKNLRMAQAKAAEPGLWDLLRATGEQFSKGRRVSIEGKPYKMRWLSQLLPVYSLSFVVLLLFVFFYSCFILYDLAPFLGIEIAPNPEAVK